MLNYSLGLSCWKVVTDEWLMYTKHLHTILVKVSLNVWWFACSNSRIQWFVPKFHQSSPRYCRKKEARWDLHWYKLLCLIPSLCMNFWLRFFPFQLGKLDFRLIYAVRCWFIIYLWKNHVFSHVKCDRHSNELINNFDFKVNVILKITTHTIWNAVINQMYSVCFQVFTDCVVWGKHVLLFSTLNYMYVHFNVDRIGCICESLL